MLKICEGLQHIESNLRAVVDEKYDADYYSDPETNSQLFEIIEAIERVSKSIECLEKVIG